MPSTLVIGQGAPWEAPSHGSAQRQLGMLRGVLSAGPVDYVSLDSRIVAHPSDPPFDVRSMTRLFVPSRRPGPIGHLDWLASQALPSLREPRATPFELHRIGRPSRERFQCLQQLASGADVVWFSRAGAAHAAMAGQDGKPRPTVVDLDDLEQRKLRLALEVLAGDQSRKPRDLYRQIYLRVNARLWSRWTDWIASAVTTVLLASDTERALSGFENAVTMPNGVVIPPFVGARPVSPLPTLLFHGLMTYAPNQDGAQFFVSRILPSLRRTLPHGFAVRIVGRAGDDVLRLSGEPEVTVTGYVDVMDHELARADVVIVPLRIGSGTRIKIIEAFAHQIPVVTTRVGCEGLAIEAGVHALVADDAEGFARHCQTAVSDVALRQSVVVAAYELASRHFDWADVEQRAADLVRTLATAREVS